MFQCPILNKTLPLSILESIQTIHFEHKFIFRGYCLGYDSHSKESLVCLSHENVVTAYLLWTVLPYLSSVGKIGMLISY